jgi:hypothetical protein
VKRITSLVEVQAGLVLHNKSRLISCQLKVGQTFDEEDMSGSILLVALKVADDSVDVLRCGHQKVHGLKAGLLVSVGCN